MFLNQRDSLKSKLLKQQSCCVRAALERHTEIVGGVVLCLKHFIPPVPVKDYTSYPIKVE